MSVDLRYVLLGCVLGAVIGAATVVIVAAIIWAGAVVKRPIGPLAKLRPYLKLYVWHSVLNDYTDGCGFALASNVRQARQLILEASGLKRPNRREGVAGLSWLNVAKELKRRKPEVYQAPIGVAVYGGG